MAFIVVGAAVVALWQPQACNWIKTGAINYLLGVVMFGMGLTLKAEDFKIVFSRPKEVIVGFLAQFALMPLIAFLLIKILPLVPNSLSA